MSCTPCIPGIVIMVPIIYPKITAQLCLVYHVYLPCIVIMVPIFYPRTQGLRLNCVLYTMYTWHSDNCSNFLPKVYGSIVSFTSCIPGSDNGSNFLPKVCGSIVSCTPCMAGKVIMVPIFYPRFTAQLCLVHHVHLAS